MKRRRGGGARGPGRSSPAGAGEGEALGRALLASLDPWTESPGAMRRVAAALDEERAVAPRSRWAQGVVRLAVAALVLLVVGVAGAAVVRSYRARQAAVEEAPGTAAPAASASHRRPGSARAPAGAPGSPEASPHEAASRGPAVAAASSRSLEPGPKGETPEVSPAARPIPPSPLSPPVPSSTSLSSPVPSSPVPPSAVLSPPVPSSPVPSSAVPSPPWPAPATRGATAGVDRHPEHAPAAASPSPAPIASAKLPLDDEPAPAAQASGPTALAPRPVFAPTIHLDPSAAPPAEAHLFTRAFAALRGGNDPATAAALLAEYRNLYPRGTLIEEAYAFALEAALRRGDPEAGALTAEYLRRFPGGRYAAAVRQTR